MSKYHNQSLQVAIYSTVVIYYRCPFPIGWLITVIEGWKKSRDVAGAGTCPIIEHHPNIGDRISNRYLKVMFKIPKMGHLPNPVRCYSEMRMLITIVSFWSGFLADPILGPLRDCYTAEASFIVMVWTYKHLSTCISIHIYQHLSINDVNLEVACWLYPINFTAQCARLQPRIRPAGLPVIGQNAIGPSRRGPFFWNVLCNGTYSEL